MTPAKAPLRVVLVTHYFPEHRGGVERIAGELALRLVAAGVARIDWYASDCDRPPPPAPRLEAFPQRSWNFAERRLGVPYPVWSPAALRRLARACQAADVVHLHDCLYVPSLAAFAAARRAKRPVVVTQHVGHVPYRNPLLSALHHLANRWLGRAVLGGADRTIFESQSVLEYFARFVRYRAAPTLIENGVDTEAFKPATAAERALVRQRIGVPANRPLLLFVGRFVEKKGLPVLRELTERLQDAHWLFAGWGPLDPGDWSRPNVTVLRRPQPRDLPALYHAADLLVLPSVGEGMPLSVQEAMACGTPALVGTETAAGSPHATGVLLAEPAAGTDTAERWAARLQSLLAAPDRLVALRAEAAAYAREHWSWEACASRYAEILWACARSA